jgi:hypothetical protein
LNDIMQSARKLARALRFRLKSELGRIPVPDTPHMEPAGLACFAKYLADSRVYLEWGSGGSTMLACAGARRVVSVDSDPVFLRRVKHKVRRLQLPAKAQFVHANIGLVRAWGNPEFTAPTRRRLRSWKRYARAPWTRFDDGVLPDLVLIDGRFRVACAMETLLRCAGHPCTLIVDDYVDRPEYHALDQFLEIIETTGRLIVARARPDKLAACRDAIAPFYADWR